MRLGVLRESKDRELRVALRPDGARTLREAGLAVFLAAGAGEGSGFPDEAYEDVGVTVLDDPEEVIAAADLLLKVKEPTEQEVDAMRPGQVIFSYLHLAPQPKLTEHLLEREVIALGYENVEDEEGGFPLLAPMSEVAGRLAVQIGAWCLQSEQGGRGILLGGVPGVPHGQVTVIGAGIVGTAAVRMAVALGAEVDVLDIDSRRLAHLEEHYGAAVQTLYSDAANLERSLLETDVVVGAVLLPGARAPRIVTREMVRRMRPGSVIVDVSIDQGGCVETMRPTSHTEPTYIVDRVLHYGVPNIPGAVPYTSTIALSNATFPYVRALLERGVDAALRADPALARSVNVYRGVVTLPGVAESLGVPCVRAPWEG